MWDVARALVTIDLNETISVMNRYGATYIFVTKDDAAKAGTIFKIVGVNPGRFVTSEGFTEDGQKTTLYKILRGISIESFQIAYNNVYVIIYKLKF